MTGDRLANPMPERAGRGSIERFAERRPWLYAAVGGAALLLAVVVQPDGTAPRPRSPPAFTLTAADMAQRKTGGLEQCVEPVDKGMASVADNEVVHRVKSRCVRARPADLDFGHRAPARGTAR